MNANSYSAGGSKWRATLLAAVALAAAARPAGAAAPDTGVARRLASAGDAEARREILQQLGEADEACPALTRFGTRSDPAVREQAVRTMEQGGCAAIEYYRPYMRDAHPWVTDALVAAFERHVIGEAIPFLISHLSDPRRIVSGGGSWTLGERAHRALRVVSCQSLHFDPAGSARERARAAARWTTWYTEHGDEPRSVWIEAGLARASDYLGRDDGLLRLEGLELLLLIGEPEAPEVRRAFHRERADLDISLSCSPDEPPRPTEEVPCRFTVSNRSARWVPLIPGGLDVAVGRPGAEEESILSQVDPPEPAIAMLELWEQMIAWLPRLVDLAPGERLEWPIAVGPVPAAGRYDVSVVLTDLADRMIAPDAAALGRGGPPLKAGVEVRFNR